MNNKNKMKVHLIRFIILCTMIILSIFIINSGNNFSFSEFSFSENAKPIRQNITEFTEEIKIIYTGNSSFFEYELTLKKSTTSEVELNEYKTYLDFNNDLIYIIFENFIPRQRINKEREYFILKIFYNFTEIEFKIGEATDYVSEFIFNLSEGYKAHIPINLPEQIVNNNKNGIFTIGIFASPHFNAVDRRAQWYNHCSEPICIVEYTLSNERAGAVISFVLNNGIVKERSIENDIRYRFSVNPEFLTETFEDILNSGLPSPWLVNRGAEVKIGYDMLKWEYSTSTIHDYVYNIVALLNWNQIKIGDQQFISRGKTLDRDIPSFRHFTIIAPEIPGYYDLVVFSTVQNQKENNFFISEVAIRFTLKVK